ncbi:branched-chain amino acid ABC transporter substrate-binding protein [Actinoallomurus rhizosphaericola]|uniref:branched-chain amino acid ABC transporter substrate-binding protein n=1 Tax=Actinoallomurus rhizosphaericola TaxID=2952536 RepID=UPI0020938C0A|nr:branched-chain amino acid ABC transporter substrate-binding protein [Actinoallomurus rhizosphaericola]MCO6000339.1 branched-chain amino acid ABC transporter substrate-binding protein [Actinoallomurus rhizosphaericola]
MRSRLITVVGVVAASATLALGASACGGNSKGGGDNVTIGFMGDLTGENSGIVIPPKQGAQLAIDQYNATNPKVKITLKTYDSQGKGEQAVPLAKQAITKDKIAGLIGPTFSSESAQADPVLEEGKLPNISSSATNAALATHGWKYWHRLIANDNVQGAGIGEFISNGLKAKKVFIIHDNSEYGKPLGETVKATVEKAGAQTSEDAIDPNGSDFSATVNKVKAFAPDAIFFGGYYSAGGKLIKQLREGGVKARFLSGDGSLDQGLAKGAGGTNADGSIIGCPCLIDPSGTASAASKKFAEDYKAKFHADPAIYSAEGYDAATAFIEAVKAGNTTPEKINDFLTKVDKPGVSKQIKFQSNGEPTATDVYVYEVKGTQLPLLGSAKNATVK